MGKASGQTENKMQPTIQEMISALEAAGWHKWKGHATIWVSPWGALFRGPFKAWTIMKDSMTPRTVSVARLGG
jgi:hypothetical protein